MIATVNPATGETLRVFPALSPEEVDDRIARSAAAFLDYRRTPLGDRLRCLARTADLLEAEQDALGRIMTLEMGKPLAAARQEAAKCAAACRYYVEHGERLMADEPAAIPGASAFIRYQPIGPVLAVMPWNFPFWQVFRFVAPALTAGNTGLLKHASNVPQCALAIEDLVRRAGFPADVFQTLLIGSDLVPRILDDPRVMAATLTGSEPAGREVAARAGLRLKKTVLELGGSDPFVVTAHADLPAAARAAAQARTVNSGQSCIAAKRFIVVEAVADEFQRRFVAEMESLVVGDPLDERTQVGPLATAAILAELEDQVRRSLGRILTGGRRLPRPGNFYAPTVLADVPPGSPAAREEMFGPVAALFRVPDLDAAIALANDTPFGLGAAAFTRDPAEQSRLTNELDAGMVFINRMVASDPRLPFGGIKTSGYGRELAAWGLREFLNIKTVVAAPAS
ncbi:MAG: NAD-dependent succinate-semialdehyde dehydrogenase [Acidobacteriota bacterium]|nr:NAD-dependent succinate-semialdehyde dehydrogenase [Acidobacteriota bacterium]